MLPTSVDSGSDSVELEKRHIACLSFAGLRSPHPGVRARARVSRMAIDMRNDPSDRTI